MKNVLPLEKISERTENHCMNKGTLLKRKKIDFF